MVAVPEYRRAGMAEEGWTGTFDDIALAADQVSGIAGAHGADTSTVIWAGHSAGGHLALWAAARPGLPPGSPWRGAFPATGVVSLAGCSSLRLCAEWNRPAAMTKRKAGPPGPAFRKVAAGNNPDRWSSVPCYRNAPQKGTAPRENRGTEVTSKQTCGETPLVWRFCADGPLIRSWAATRTAPPH